MLPRKPLRSFRNDHHVRRVLENLSRQPHRVLDAMESRGCAGPQRGAFHHYGVAFHMSVAVQMRAIAGVKHRIVFEDNHRRFHGVQCAAAGLQHCPARLQRSLAPGLACADGLIRNVPRTAVNDQGRFHSLDEKIEDKHEHAKREQNGRPVHAGAKPSPHRAPEIRRHRLQPRLSANHVERSDQFVAREQLPQSRYFVIHQNHGTRTLAPNHGRSRHERQIAGQRQHTKLGTCSPIHGASRQTQCFCSCCFGRPEASGGYSSSWMVTSRTTSNSFFPAGVVTSISSPTLRFSSARPIGEVVEIRPFSTSASSLETSLYSIFASFCKSITTIREPYPERSLGILLRFSIPRSPMRFLSCAIRAFTKLCRSLANLYSAFSDKSPCARATAISFGRSTFSSCSSASISSCSFCLIFFSGSDMVSIFQTLCQKRLRSPALLEGPPGPALRHYRGRSFRATSDAPGNQRTCSSTLWLCVRPVPSSIVSVYVVVLAGDTSTQRLGEGQTGFSCGSSLTLLAFATP